MEWIEAKQEGHVFCEARMKLWKCGVDSAPVVARRGAVLTPPCAWCRCAVH